MPAGTVTEKILLDHGIYRLFCNATVTRHRGCSSTSR
jgi:hypothetical protein